jgi:carbamoyl-phosphate synthase large subunit
MGGQTALNMALSLKKRGFLERTGIRVLGTSAESIEIAEDREKFHELMISIGEPVAPSARLRKDSYESSLQSIDFYPLIVRTSFSLGGSGGRIIRDRQELEKICQEYFSIYPEETLELEKSLEGLKEIEYEVIRDNAGNCITICNMENLDPMGVHTGESIVVTPSQTLSDIQYHMLRDSAIRVISSLEIRGACNIQFALDSSTNSYYIVEVNPRTSRSSALASKASGYPIARTSSKIAVGYNLPEIRNPITQNTYAAYEPSLDYITVKIPRWPFDKFDVDRRIGVQMKSIGEVMGIGRTFEEALMKAVASLDTPESRKLRLGVDDAKLSSLISIPSDLRLFAIFEALFRNWDISHVSRISGYPEYFIAKMANITRALGAISRGTVPEDMAMLKRLGIPDSIITVFTGIRETDIIMDRITSGILPVFKAIDTCSGEFETQTPYLYSTYESEDEKFQAKKNRGTVVVIGSGPNRISQGLEFDYGAVKAVLELRRMGYRTVMVNSNPETVSTDFDISDSLYFEPLDLEHISNVIMREQPCRIIIQFSGQTGQNLASDLEKIFGASIFMGTMPDSIDEIEDRKKFAESLDAMGMLQPEFVTISNMQQAVEAMEKVRLPLIVRSSFIIGGRAMDIVNDRDDLFRRISDLLNERPQYPILLSRYVEDATEIDVDFVSDGRNSVIAGICVHIEEAGTHSGDATMVMGPGIPSPEIASRITSLVRKFTERFSLRGFSNLQLAVKDDRIYIIELNARASRSLPFVSKATGRDWIGIGISAMTGHRIHEDPGNPSSYFVKVPAFPFNRFLDLDAVLGPEMKSTGEGMSAGKTLEEAMEKALKLMRISIPHGGKVLVSVSDRDKPALVPVARSLAGRGFSIYATPGTRKYLEENGIAAGTVFKIEDLRKPGIDEFIASQKPVIIINTPNMRSGAIRDGNEIRKMAIRSNIPLITNIRLAESLARALEAESKPEYLEIGEYW